MRKKERVIFVVIATVVVVFVIASYFFMLGNNESADPKTSPATTEQPIGADWGKQITREGEAVCLSRKEGSVQTQECAWGLHATDGHFYSLLLNQTTDFAMMNPIVIGARYRISGILHEPRLDSQYVAVGTIEVLKYIELPQTIPIGTKVSPKEMKRLKEQAEKEPITKEPLPYDNTQQEDL
ncbi:MAG: hypothetical protein G01um101470_773 [Parcubacteria group bacterium Gr01-1014_70]|nr:MAG: hypothetical protein G01um101470_773 [Parcubacteria group bacterium Gr01-1014_70]